MKPNTIESDHFILHFYDDDRPVIDKILKNLESNYKRITSLLQVELPEKSVLHIYPSLEIFHEAIGEPEVETWRVGRFDKGIMKMVSPNNPGPDHDYDSIMAVAIHEFVHLAAEQINSDAPDYIAEGLATYLANQGGAYIKDAIQDDLNSGSFPSLAQVRDMADYIYSYALMKYVASEYGVEGMLKLYKTADIYKAFGVSDDELYEKWKTYLVKTYSIECDTGTKH